MKVIEPKVEFLIPFDGDEIIKKIELAGRTCYKSEDKIADGSAEKFIHNIIKRGHESVLEHGHFSVRFTVDRAIANEVTRHRLASYSQESTRYCNYSLDKFDNEITVIRPCFWEDGSDEYAMWSIAMDAAENAYFDLIAAGATPQEARSVLPCSLKTELVMSANVREWRHFLKQRCSVAAHPQIRQVAIELLRMCKEKMPVLFDDLTEE